MVPVGGFLSHGEPLKFLVVWGCFQAHFIQVDEDSIGNWHLVSLFFLLTWLDVCHKPKSQKWIYSLNSKHVPIIWSTLPLEALPSSPPLPIHMVCVIQPESSLKESFLYGNGGALLRLGLPHGGGWVFIFYHGDFSGFSEVAGCWLIDWSQQRGTSFLVRKMMDSISFLGGWVADLVLQ